MIRLRWKPLRAGEWNAIPEKKRRTFKGLKGVKRTPIRGADIEGHYYLDIYESGRRSYEFLDLKTTSDAVSNDKQERLALDVAQHWNDEAWRVSHGYGSKLKGDVSFLEYFKSLAHARDKTWRSALLSLMSFPERNTGLNVIDTKWLVSFQAHLHSKVSQNTSSTYYSKIRAALQIAFENEIIPSNPADRVRGIRMQQSKRTYLTVSEVQALANTPCFSSETRRAFLFSCYTGLRLSDVRRLTWGEYQKGRIEFRQKKTGQPEYLDLSAIAEKLLTNGNQKRTPHDSEEPIFTLPADGTLWTYIQAWAMSAGITKHLSFHVSRHTFATLMLDSTKDLFLVSKLLGHTDIKHTQAYAKIFDDRKRHAMRSLPEIVLE